MNEFGRLLEKEIPRLRRYAFALTRNMSRADDLVQNTLVRAIAKQRCWQCGTNCMAVICRSTMFGSATRP
jgi:RNA polymerase sigma-70 factor, ECF subfamily